MVTDRALVCPDVPGVEPLLQHTASRMQRARYAAVHAGRPAVAGHAARRDA